MIFTYWYQYICSRMRRIYSLKENHLVGLNKGRTPWFWQEKYIFMIAWLFKTYLYPPKKGDFLYRRYIGIALVVSYNKIPIIKCGLKIMFFAVFPFFICVIFKRVDRARCTFFVNYPRVKLIVPRDHNKTRLVDGFPTARNWKPEQLLKIHEHRYNL